MTRFSGPWQMVSRNLKTFLHTNPDICIEGYDLDVQAVIGRVDLTVRYSR